MTDSTKTAYKAIDILDKEIERLMKIMNFIDRNDVISVNRLQSSISALIEVRKRIENELLYNAEIIRQERK